MKAKGKKAQYILFYLFIFKFYFIFKLYIIVLVYILNNAAQEAIWSN